MTIEEILSWKESEDNVEFKEAKNTFPFMGGASSDPKKRRKCVLGYVVALANDGGGRLVLGIKETSKNCYEVVGSNFREGSEGQLEQDIYAQKAIKVQCMSVIDAHGRRVLVISVPKRPVGQVYKFEDVPLWRVGDGLRRMDDSRYFQILSEQEPDYSATICEGLTINQLDETAIRKMRIAYSQKQNNVQALTLSDHQFLEDLGLIIGEKCTYASLILVGKKHYIREHLPQAAIYLEYRNLDNQIPFDNREKFEGSYFAEIDRLWKTINLRNTNVPVQEGAFIFDIPYFNQEVIREAINNAVAHRNYRLNSETVIKQYRTRFDISSPGGFPVGVTVENIITVNSTPRNRLIAEVLSKTGTVERSGQGVDKIYLQCIAEAKGVPDYSKSSDFQVYLSLPGIVKDIAFAKFIDQMQREKPTHERLSVQEIIVLEQVRTGLDKRAINKLVAKKLVQEGYLVKVGTTRNQKLMLSKEYYEFANSKGKYTAEYPLSINQIGILVVAHLKEFGEARMSDFVQLFQGRLTPEQTKKAIYKLNGYGVIDRTGQGRGTKYAISKQALEEQKILKRVMELGVEEMIRLGELPKSESDIDRQ